MNCFHCNDLMSIDQSEYSVEYNCNKCDLIIVYDHIDGLLGMRFKSISIDFMEFKISEDKKYYFSDVPDNNEDVEKWCYDSIIKFMTYSI